MRHMPMRTILRRALGLMVATIVAWALIAAPTIYSIISRPIMGSPGKDFGLLATLYAAILGLPVSLVFCFLAGGVAWRLGDRHGVTGVRGHLRIGAGLGIVAFGLLQATFPPIASLGFAPRDVLPLWSPAIALSALLGFVYFIAVGAIAAISARFVAGGRSARDAESEP